MEWPKVALSQHMVTRQRFLFILFVKTDLSALPPNCSLWIQIGANSRENINTGHSGGVHPEAFKVRTSMSVQN